MKRNLFFIFLSFIGFTSYSTTSAINLKNGETLMLSNYKVIEHGHFVFIVFIGDTEIKKMVYYYSINIKKKKVTCFKDSKNIYNARDKEEYLKNAHFQTAKEFKHSQINTWREKYYTCFANNFLEMTNDEKIDLLNMLSEK
jgi:hypothetical protein